MTLSLYLLRHGQTEYSRDNAFCGAGINPDLTSMGQDMARQFAEAYKATTWQAIYCSPLKRAMQTAKPICDAINLAPELRENLKEIHYGKWEGESVETVSQAYHDDHLRWTADPAWNSPTDGETAVAIATRALQVVEEIKENHHTGNVLVVSHKATIRIIISSLLGIDVGRFRYRIDCPVASLSRIDFKAQGPFLRILADRSHLSPDLRNAQGT